MAKKELEIVLNTGDNTLKTNVFGIVSDNVIKYNDDGVMVVLNIDSENIKMTRTTDEYQLILDFCENKNKIGNYILKENNMKLDISLYTEKLVIDNNRINIIYIINDEKKVYSLLIKE